MTSSTATRTTKLLVQILATLGVSAVASSAACTKAIVSPEGSSDAIKECPDDKGHYAEWPDGKQPGMGAGINDVCLPKPANGKCSGYTAKCVMSRFHCGVSTGGDKVLDVLPTKNPEVCCFKVAGGCAVGRPFVVDGSPRVAELTSGSDWSAAIEGVIDAVDLDALSNEERTKLGDIWARDGLTEHASVASFAQLILELLALGAPARLVRGAQEAMADEIRHAERAFALASFYAGVPVAPTALDTRGVAIMAGGDLADFAARTASEACIAETIAALQLHAAADAAREPALASLLRTTAEEESTHALLGYEIVRWAIAKGGEDVRARVAKVFAEASVHVGFGAVPQKTIDLRAHGVLSHGDRHALAIDALQGVIAPAASAVAVTCS